jgi:NADPH-dependent glutamate synthase beta subunit-like oxidoreductase
MGHKVTVFERRKQLGGMLRYGIPAYRFPRELLDLDINAILATGVEVKLDTDVGTDIAYDDIVKNYDSVYISIGAHTDSKARIDGEKLKGVISAVELLKGIGDGVHPDFTGKTVAVIGGGNVAMDATRTSVRLGAEKVYCVYRRRQVDMPALPEEVEGAIAEGAEILTLKAPARIEGDENGNAAALWVKPQISGLLDDSGRPSPVDAALPEERIPVDLIIVAVGQKIETAVYEKAGIPVSRGAIVAMKDGRVFENGKIFAGGDCATGPATAIRAIAAGKVAAANIDQFLGYNHEISVDFDIPVAKAESKPARGRINTTERLADDRKKDFTCIEYGMTEEGALTEASRCLRCAHYGCGALKGGRINKW